MRGLFAAMVSALALVGVPAMACTPAPGDQVEARARDLRAVTSIYEARIENDVLHDEFGDNLDFTVQPTARIWGDVAPVPARLSFTAGACTNWFFLMEGPVDPRGLRVIVLASPESLSNGRSLYILRADADYIETFMRDWRAARAGEPLSRP
jgi:hypothetical protein